jgi:hypothetical protein
VKLYFFSLPKYSRNCQRFFVQVGHETTGACIGKKHFFTEQCHRQTNPNYEQSRQKLGTFLENKLLSTIFIDISWSLNQIVFIESFLERLDQFLMLKNYFENQNFVIFAKVVHNFGKSDTGII